MGQEESEVRRGFGEAFCQSCRSLRAMLPRPTILGEYCYTIKFLRPMPHPQKKNKKEKVKQRVSGVNLHD